MATTTTTLATLRARALAAGYVLTLDCDLRARPLDCTDTDCPLHGTSESAHAVRVAYNRGDAFAVRDTPRPRRRRTHSRLDVRPVPALPSPPLSLSGW